MANPTARTVFFFLACTICLPGCGDSKPFVRGKVTYKSSPLTSGEVSFIGKSGTPRSALITSEGTYEINDAPLGEVTVTVVSFKTGALNSAELDATTIQVLV